MKKKKNTKERIKRVKELIIEIQQDPEAMKELNKWMKRLNITKEDLK